MNDIDAGVLAQSVLVFIAKRCMNREEAEKIAALLLSDSGAQSLRKTKPYKALPEKDDA